MNGASRRVRRLFGVVCFGVWSGLIGCAPTRVALKSTFWQNKAPKIAVVTGKMKPAASYKAGAQGLLDIAINSAMASDLDAYLAKLEIVGFDDERTRFAQELAQRGFSVKESTEPVDVSSDKTLQAALSDIRIKENVDLVLVLTVERWGTLRAYYGFIPLGDPQALFDVKGRMFDVTHNNELVWQAIESDKQASKSIADPWDQRPKFQNLAKAMNDVMAASKAFLFNEFFGSDKKVSLIPRALLPIMSGCNS